MKAAIENFAAIQAGHKVLMLGAMAEAGPESLQEHRANSIRLFNSMPGEAVVLVGGDFLKIDHPFIKKENAWQAGEWFR